MDLGICVASDITDIDYVVEAERLGYTRAWFADSQMLWSDPYACLALAATRTSTIGLGTGVAVAATRPAPVTAASIATINALAPGRTFLGIGTGNTAMRIMGHPPMRIAEFDEYLRALGPLLRGDESEVTFRGKTSPVRHVMPDAGFVDFAHEIAVHVSAFGERSLEVAGRHGDGVILPLPPTPAFLDRFWVSIEEGAGSVGRVIDRAEYYVSCLTTIVVLDEDERADSERAKYEAGAFAMAAVHYAYDQWRNFGRPPTVPAIVDIWDDYTALVEQTPADRLHQRIHRGHNCWVEPDEEQFLTDDLMRQTTLTGTANEIVERLEGLAEHGLDHVMVLPSLAPRVEVLRRVARGVMPHLARG